MMDTELFNAVDGMTEFFNAVDGKTDAELSTIVLTWEREKRLVTICKALNIKPGRSRNYRAALYNDLREIRDLLALV